MVSKQLSYFIKNKNKNFRVTNLTLVQVVGNHRNWSTTSSIKNIYVFLEHHYHTTTICFLLNCGNIHMHTKVHVWWVCTKIGCSTEDCHTSTWQLNCEVFFRSSKFEKLVSKKIVCVYIYIYIHILLLMSPQAWTCYAHCITFHWTLQHTSIKNVHFNYCNVH